MTNLGQDDHLVCPHMSCNFDLRLTFDLDIGVNAKIFKKPFSRLATAATYIDLIVTNLGQDDRWVCPQVSHNLDLRLAFDLDIGVNPKFVGTYFMYCQKLSSTCFVLIP